MKWRWGWPGHVGSRKREVDGRFYGCTFRRTFIGVWRVDRRIRVAWPRTVWCCETIDYDPVFMGVWSSPEQAYEGVKSVFGPPYTVKWSPLLKLAEATYEFSGVFKALPNWITAHTERYRIWAEEFDNYEPP